MIIGARNGAWAKSGYTARDYVQDGLTAMWDGIENAGWGVHDSAVDTWTDLSGNGFDFKLNPNSSRVSFGPSYLDMRPIAQNNGNDQCAAYTPIGIIGKTRRWECIEIVYAPHNHIMDIFNPGNQSYSQNYGFYASLTAIQFGTAQSTDKWRYLRNNPIDEPYYAACNMIEANSVWGAKHDGFINGVHVEPTDKGATSNYFRGECTSLGGRYQNGFVTDWGGSGRIFALRLHRRRLTDTEIAHNYAIDKARFNLP